MCVLSAALLVAACTASTAAPALPAATSLPPTAPPAAPTSIPLTLTYQEAVRLYDYNPALPFDLKERSVKDREGVAVHDINYTGATEGRTLAYLVVPPGSGPFAGLVFMHWAGASLGDRNEFLEEAVGLARKGTLSLLIQGRFPWSVGAQGYEADRLQVIHQVIELRRAIDLLLSQPGVDPQRVGYVGHDYGAMYGGILSGVDQRVKAYVLVTGTTNFSDWLLRHFSLPNEEETQKYRDAMALVDPVAYLGHAAPAALFFQFSKEDTYVTSQAAEALFGAGSQPKLMKSYDSSHAMLGEDVQSDRIEWLTEQLGLSN